MRTFGKNLLIFSAAGLIALGAAPAVFAQTAGQPIVNVDFPCPNGLGLGNCQPSTDIPSYLNNLYKFAVYIAGLLALAMIVGGGIYYSLSAGSGDKQREAKSMITSAVLGILLLFGSYLILNTVNPQITKLQVTSTTVTGELIAISPATSSQEGAAPAGSECGEFSSMPVNTSGFGNPVPTCANRKLLSLTKFNIQKSRYYGDDYSAEAGSIAWVYPYYIPDSSEHAQCLIYAYREPVIGNLVSSTKMVDLKPNLRLCNPQPQKTELSCAEWKFTANGTNGVVTPWCIPGITCPSMEPVSFLAPVSGSFNYPDVNSPPPTDNTRKCPAGVVPSYKYCWSQTWSCTKTK